MCWCVCVCVCVGTGSLPIWLNVDLFVIGFPGHLSHRNAFDICLHCAAASHVFNYGGQQTCRMERVRCVARETESRRESEDETTDQSDRRGAIVGECDITGVNIYAGEPYLSPCAGLHM